MKCDGTSGVIQTLFCESRDANLQTLSTLNQDMKAEKEDSCAHRVGIHRLHKERFLKVQILSKL